MASWDSPDPRPASPKEDYNPLNDDLHIGQELIDEDYDADSPGSSLSLDGDYMDVYGITPPANPRELKRRKERSRSTKQKEEKLILAVDKTIARRKTYQAIGTLPVDDLVTIRIDDIAYNTPPDLSKRGSKTFKHVRSYDRDLKNTENSMPATDANSNTLAAPSAVESIKIDSPNRYCSINSKHIVVDDASPALSMLNVRRKYPATPVECPSDREEFYKTFSTLVNMWNTAGKEKKETKASPYQRQLSSEQEVWQTKVNDLLWLELQAWHMSRSMKEQDDYLCQAREQVPKVLQEIMEFTVKLPEHLIQSESPHNQSYSSSTSDQAGVLFSLDDTPEENSIPPESTGNVLLDGVQEKGENFLALPRSSPQQERAHTPCSGPSLLVAIEAQKQALMQVTTLLIKLEQVEQLYPNTKALSREHPLYTQEAFQRRVKTLCLWMNVTKDIAHRLQLMAKIFSIDHLEGIEWPWLDYQSPKQMRQNIANRGDTITPTCTQGCQDEGDSSKGAGDFISPAENVLKNVRFENVCVRDASLDLTPSDTSTPTKSPSNKTMLLDMSRISSSMSMEELSHTSPYRYFVDRTLKKTGLMKMLKRLKELLHRTACRARQGLERHHPRPTYADITSNKTELTHELSSSPSFLEFTPAPPRSFSDLNLQCHNVDGAIGSADFESMLLPSFKPTYLFLVRIPLDVVHECLRLRLEQKPEMEPSLLSVRQLIRECKEVLLGSVMVKQYYQQMVVAVTAEEHSREKCETDLEAFEEDMKDMLEVYFNYIQVWMCELQNLPEMSKRLKNALEVEWNFTKEVCPHVRGGEANASNRFCTMSSSLLKSISDFLEREMDECIYFLYDVTSMTTEEPDSMDRSSKLAELRQNIIHTCRNFKVTFHEARERASKALGFAKMLRKDLEIAADFNIVVTAGELLQKLSDTGHFQVMAPHSAGYLMFIPGYIATNQTQVLRLLNVTCGREDTSYANAQTSDGYLLLVKCEGCSDMERTCPLWEGSTLKVEPTAETTIALSHLEVECLLLVVIHSSQLSAQRKKFELLMKDTVQMVSENTSCHQAIADSLAELKTSALELREKVADAIRQVDEKLDLEDIPEMDEAEKLNLQKLYRETLHQCYNFGFEYHKEVIRLVSGEMRIKLARTLIEFTKQWMRFVSEKCERGRGLRPRWANQGLDFLIVACEPRNLTTLTPEEFLDLRNKIKECISHVIGDKGVSGSPGVSFRIGSPDLTSSRQHSLLRIQSCPDTLRSSRNTSRPTQSEPPTPSYSTVSEADGASYRMAPTFLRKSASSDGSKNLDAQDEEERKASLEQNYSGLKGKKTMIADNVDQGHSYEGDLRTEEESNRMTRIVHAIQRYEQDRTNELYNRHIIGRVTNKRVEVDYRINIRRVNFKWQRGFKIGEGQFGKVYTAVNIDTGELLAMKEIRFQPNDHQTIKNITDEIKRFEGISHQSLVKYYGVEVHRDEMLIFMEYCSEGTVAEVAALGLSEPMIRKYTSEILVAVNVLHDHGIVHRDIKGANIFLTPDGLKLGDFGCSVQLKSHTTMPGEVGNLAGTTAYMAPEVITQNSKEGSGRAADIWSLGCVVIEMATGKRPWHELENNFMIMFKVGMGGKPSIPEHLSEEGKDFMLHCLESDPHHRWTASQLQDHAFVKVYNEEDGENDEGKYESSV